jgi:hypothetical protein
VVDPIARLSLEGGYDSNVLHDGTTADRVGRVSPELGLRARDPRWRASLAWRGDWIRYERLAPEGTWNHRGTLLLDGRITRRLRLDANLRGSWTDDPVGLALAGVFRPGRRSALVLGGAARADYRWSRRVDAALTFSERTVRFEDATGGAMHAPGVEALWRMGARLSLGAAYGLAAFQGFDPRGDELAFSHGLKARARYRASRRLSLEATAGPALWVGRQDRALVPEVSLLALATSRFWDVRASLSHGLGIGSTATPGLVDALELGAERRFGRRLALRADGGLWHSGIAPSGREAVTGWAASGEALVLVGMNVRVGIGATHFARLDSGDPAHRRTTVGVRLGWELPVR